MKFLFSETRYSNLCELCDNPALCSYNTNDYAPKNALKCLNEKYADVAYTTASAVREYFTGLLENKRLDYALLCRNGQTIPLSDVVDENCTWRNQPWTLVLSNK